MESKTFLFVLWEGGGNVPPILGLAHSMVERGHRVLVISDPCNGTEARAAGCEFISYTRAPHRYSKSADTTLVKDYETANPIKGFQIFLDEIACGPALEYAKDVLDVLNKNHVDVVVTSEAMFGGCFAAEVRNIPCVMLIPATYNFPAQGMPPPGMMPKKGFMAFILGNLASFFFKRLIAHGLPAFNKARKELGLKPAKEISDYLTSSLHRILVMTSPDFDFPAKLPGNVRYTGPMLDDPFMMQNWEDPWPATDHRKLILVGFSTTYQQHENILQNIMDALGADAL